MRKIIFLLASLSFFILGIAHVIGHFIVMHELKGSMIYLNMDSVEISVIGTKKSINEFLKGFSITMGVLMIFIGLLNFLTWVRFNDEILKAPSLLLLNALLALTLALLSVFYFPWPPIIVFSLVFFAFSFLFITSFKKSEARTI